MLGNDFTTIESILSLGETIFCVYIYIKYDVTKAIQYMRWKGFRADLMYRMKDCLIFYQDERFIPDLDEVDHFYREVDEDIVWSKAEALCYDYKYRVLSKGVVCISFYPILYGNEYDDIENASPYEGTGKLKKE